MARLKYNVHAIPFRHSSTLRFQNLEINSCFVFCDTYEKRCNWEQGTTFLKFTQNSSKILNRMALWPSASDEYISFSGCRPRKYIIPPVRLRGFKVIQIAQYGYNSNHRWERKTLNLLTHLGLILVS